MFRSLVHRGPRAALRPPGLCEVCRAWCDGALCTTCTRRFAPAASRCMQCALALGESAGGRCGECLREPPPFARTVCVADYGFPWSRLIADFKFNDRPELAAPLAAAIARAAVEQGHEPPGLLVPVPLSPERLAGRGYNQAWELARRAARLVGSPAAADVLERRFDHPAQAGLPRARRLANLRGAFAVAPRGAPRLEGRHVVLVDDVMTTGATARAAAAALLDGGASRVDVWVLARTPAD